MNTKLLQILGISIGGLALIWVAQQLLRQDADMCVVANELNRAGFDAIDEASADSFPASDPPARTPISRAGGW